MGSKDKIKRKHNTKFHGEGINFCFFGIICDLCGGECHVEIYSGIDDTTQIWITFKCDPCNAQRNYQFAHAAFRSDRAEQEHRIEVARYNLKMISKQSKLSTVG